jgi:F0F1-type ATP synthase assembly protein I
LPVTKKKKKKKNVHHSRTPGACFWFPDAFKLIATTVLLGAVTSKLHQLYDAAVIKHGPALRF